jgi:hypothetical protein
VAVTSRSCPPNCPPSSSALVRLDATSAEVLDGLAKEGFGFVAAGAGSIWRRRWRAGAANGSELISHLRQRRRPVCRHGHLRFSPRPLRGRG